MIVLKCCFFFLFQNPLNPQSSQFEPANKLCLFEVDKSMVTIVLPSDSSVQIHCLLNECVVEDVRKGIISEFPRYEMTFCSIMDIR